MIDNFKDNLLITRIRKKDTEAFAEIYDKYIKKIYRFIVFRVPSKEQAEDLTQEVFMGLLEYIKKTEVYVESVQALIYKIARNKIAGYYEKNKQLKNLEFLANNLADSQVETDNLLISAIDLETEIDEKKNIELIISALNQWSNKEFKEIITLRYIEQLSHAEIASILNKTENNIRVMAHRALKEFKKILANKISK